MKTSMNLFKRAWWRLSGTFGKTMLLTGLFFVICTLVLSGLLIRSAAESAAADAKRTVGAVATLSFDINALMESGQAENGGAAGVQIDPADRLRSGLADQLGRSSVVTEFSYRVETAGQPTDQLELYRAVDPPPGTDTSSGDFFTIEGVRDLAAMPTFRNGTSELVEGTGITPKTGTSALVLEERLAEANDLEVGDEVTLRSFPGDGTQGTVLTFTVSGIYTSDAPPSGQYVPALAEPANLIYTSAAGAGSLSPVAPSDDGADIQQATYTLRGPDDLDQLRRDAEALGLDPEIYPISINDRQYQQLVGPISAISGLATVTVWLVSAAGVAVLSLIVAGSLRERRRELGILLALGERRTHLLGQHLVETTCCALIAVGLAVPTSQLMAQAAGDSLLAGEVSSAKQEAEADARTGNASTTGGGQPEDGPTTQPIDELDVRLTPADVATVGAAGLGIAAAATLIPGYRILRLRPREILTKGD